MKKKYSELGHIILMLLFIILIIYMLFHRLGEGFLIQTDEAWHATNAYEMYKNGNWIVNTYRQGVDYFNSKPPLCLDLMVISYKLFGVSAFSARFPSAIGGLLICLTIVIFLLLRKDLYAATLFPAFLAASTELFTFHMFRAAEMDSLFNLFFAVAMLSLYMMREKPDFMYVYGFSLGLAFMCKGPHAALVFVIGLLYIPVIKGAFQKIMRVVFSALLAIAVPAAWLAKRYSFDGFEMMNHLVFGEVVGRVENSSKAATNSLYSLLPTRNLLFLAAALLMVLIFAMVRHIKKKDVDGKAEGTFKVAALSWAKDNYLFMLWVAVPIVAYGIAKSEMVWYTYPSYIGLCVLNARIASFTIREIASNNMVYGLLISAAVVGFSLCSAIPCIKYDINKAGLGGNPVDQFTVEMKEFSNSYGDDRYSGVNAYLISAYRVDMANEDHWEPEYVAPAEMYCDLLPVDGGIDNFLNDKGSILILDKERWDEFAPVLTGHVILHDNSYLIFGSDMY